MNVITRGELTTPKSSPRVHEVRQPGDFVSKSPHFWPGEITMFLYFPMFSHSLTIYISMCFQYFPYFSLWFSHGFPIVLGTSPCRPCRPCRLHRPLQVLNQHHHHRHDDVHHHGTTTTGETGAEIRWGTFSDAGSPWVGKKMVEKPQKR